jgi:hypothetical protein
MHAEFSIQNNNSIFWNFNLPNLNLKNLNSKLEFYFVKLVLVIDRNDQSN